MCETHKNSVKPTRIDNAPFIMVVHNLINGVLIHHFYLQVDTNFSG